MPTLKANFEQEEALRVRQLQSVASTLRRRSDNNPGRYSRIVTDKLNLAERAIFDRRLEAAKDHLAYVDSAMNDKDAQVGTEAQLAEQERLAELRNQPTHKSETGAQTRDGWLWLKAKGRYTTTRITIGDHYREKHIKASDPLRSCLNDTPGGGGDGPSISYTHAKFELDGVKRHMRNSAGEDTGAHLYGLLESVCGRGDTVRALAGGKDRQSDAYVIELGLALDLAGVYFGMVRT